MFGKRVENNEQYLGSFFHWIRFNCALYVSVLFSPISSHLFRFLGCISYERLVVVVIWSLLEAIICVVWSLAFGMDQSEAKWPKQSGREVHFAGFLWSGALEFQARASLEHTFTSSYSFTRDNIQLLLQTASPKRTHIHIALASFLPAC